jgi:hypothetical protein
MCARRVPVSPRTLRQGGALKQPRVALGRRDASKPLSSEREAKGERGAVWRTGALLPPPSMTIWMEGMPNARERNREGEGEGEGVAGGRGGARQVKEEGEARRVKHSHTPRELFG